jgi:predicted O-linked N-acetylglucosamine transferase (SPINDLY family)
LNAVHKITPRTIRLWAEILRQVPGSRMIVLAGGSKSTVARIESEFSAGGIAPGRLSLVPRTDVRSYFRQYAQIDIALDPAPFVGHTTTCDAAWMGVPTVTLTGKIYAHRYGGSVLKSVGLDDLVTETQEAYVQAAVRLASDVERLTTLRATLRSTLQRSPMTDAAGFTRRLEAAYREMWKSWCGSSPVPSPGTPGEG